MKNHHQVTIRLPINLYQQLSLDAENRNTNLADATRLSLIDHFNRARLEDLLASIDTKVDQVLNEIKAV